MTFPNMHSLWEAREQLFTACREGRLTATGRRLPNGPREPIPAADWTACWESDGPVGWHDVSFNPEDVKRLWPRPLGGAR